jgi:hypothetical protein
VGNFLLVEASPSAPSSNFSPFRLSVPARAFLFLFTTAILAGPVLFHYNDQAFFTDVVGILAVPLTHAPTDRSTP